MQAQTDAVTQEHVRNEKKIPFILPLTFMIPCIWSSVHIESFTTSVNIVFLRSGDNGISEKANLLKLNRSFPSTLDEYVLIAVVRKESKQTVRYQVMRFNNMA